MNRPTFTLIDLLVNSKEPLSSIALSSLLNVSQRTIKRMVSAASDELKDHGAEIISDHNGYALKVTDPHFSVYWQRQVQVYRVFGIMDDTALKITELLLLNDHITQDEIADELYISRSAISSRIKDIRDLLEKEKILLSDRPHYGYYTIGAESDIRNFMVRLFFYDDLVENKESLISDTIPHFDELCKSLFDCLKPYGYTSQDARTQSIVKYMITSGLRIRIHHQIETFPLIKNAQLPAARASAAVLERFFNIEIDNKELNYLCYLLGRNNDLDFTSEDRDTSFYEKIVTEFFHEINDVYQVDFSYDNELRSGLVQHLYASYSRMYLNVLLTNPVLNVIKTSYSDAYNYAVLCSEILSSRYHLAVSEDNIGYLAMHFAAAIVRMKSRFKYRAAVVCESGMGMAMLLKEKIQSSVPTVTVTNTYSLSEIYQADLSTVDFVISSIPLEKNLAKPVLVVNHMLLDIDVKHINDFINDSQSMDKYKAVFSKDLFFYHFHAENKKQVIDDIGKILLEKNALTQENIDEIIHREKLSSTELNPLTAIPHCILDSNHKTAFAIIVLDHPIPWGKIDVQLIFLGMIARNETINKKLFPMIYKLTMDTDKVLKLCSISDFDTFLTEMFNNIPVSYQS